VADEPFQRFDGEPVVPLEVQQFVLERINSIAQLEALIMMRNAPDMWWSSSSLAERLYISERACRTELEALKAQGLVLSRQEDIGWQFRYSPVSGELREFVDRLVYYYSKHLVVISNLIHSKPRTRLHEFAEAFWLKKKDA
jgi:biotin operon repressor